MKLWGKTMAELDDDHRRMLADRLARERAMTPAELGKMYGDRLKPSPTLESQHTRMNAYHFGTDIPAPTWQEVEAERARQGKDDEGDGATIVIVASILVLALIAAAWMLLN